MTAARYDRAAASQTLADLAHPRMFADITTVGPQTITYAAHVVSPEPGSHLTAPQRLYLEKFMRPCPPAQITAAFHRITWTDSAGVPCAGHYTVGGLGPIVPIAARETTVALWQALAADRTLAGNIDRLGEDQRAILAATTTDQEPMEIIRVGVETAGRALAQHALLSPQRPKLDATGFAEAMRDGGIFATVAGQWFWELQAATLRRGMIPVRFTDAGPLRYTAESVDILRRMKDATIAAAHAIMLRATTVGGLTVDEAVNRYHDQIDLVSRQYALLTPGTRPRCPAQNAIIPRLVPAFVDTFIRLLDVIEISEDDQAPPDDIDPASFLVPDMTCKHCQVTIRGVLESMELIVREIDLVGKRVTVADFRSPRNRTRALDAVRAAGYTPLDNA